MLGTNNKNGRNIALFLGIYLVVKEIFNMIIGGFSLTGLLRSLLEAAALYTGLMYLNYVVAVVLLIVVVQHIGTNISNLGNDWRYVVYLLEGIADIVCAAAIVLQKDVKQHFTNKWDELVKK